MYKHNEVYLGTWNLAPMWSSHIDFHQPISVILATAIKLLTDGTDLANDLGSVRPAIRLSVRPSFSRSRMYVRTRTLSSA